MVVGTCALLVSPFDGALFVGINNRIPELASGVIDFDIEVANPRPDIWAQPGKRFRCEDLVRPAARQ